MIEKDRREFNSILTSINEKVADINTKMATTCEKVSSVEAGFKEIRADVKTYTERIVELEKHELSHVKHCPQNAEVRKAVEKVDKMETDLEEYRMAKKYPKAILILIIVFAMLAIGTAISTRQMVAREIQSIETMGAAIRPK